MPVRIQHLRLWLGLTALTLAMVVVGFYGYARYQQTLIIREVPKRIASEVEQNTEGFNYSQSEGGRTIFTIHASQAIRYKSGGKAQLKDVNIVVYGRKANRFDQIYGSDFEYDPQTGNIIAPGEVEIDLESDTKAAIRPDQSPPREIKNPIHLKTRGVTFNQKTGIATTDQRVEFRVPQGSGSAIGATYDSKSRAMALKSQVELDTTGPKPTQVHALHVEFGDQPHQVRLERAELRQGIRTIAADHATANLRDDNSVENVRAQGNVTSHISGKSPSEVRADDAEFKVARGNDVQNGVLHGNVSLNSSGASPMKGSAGKVLLDFSPRSKLRLIQAREAVHLEQAPLEKQPPTQLVRFAGDSLDLNLLDGNRLERGETAGAAEIIVTGKPQLATKKPASAAAGNSRTVVTAGKFDVAFGANNQIRSLHGAPDAKIVSTGAWQGNRTSTSRDLLVAFKAGAVDSILQQGDVNMEDEQRTASADQARFSPQTDMLALSGNVRMHDRINNASISSNSALLNQGSGQLTAHGDVKTTYLDLKSQPGGAMLASSDPVHVTSAEMVSEKSTGLARYSGDSRLWQGGNIVQSPVLIFDKTRRSLVATAPVPGDHDVSCVFLQTDKDGKQTPVEVTSGKLTYTDSDRRARFEGHVIAKSVDGTFKADRIDVFLKQQQAGRVKSDPDTKASEIDHMDARGTVNLQQPTRKAVGDHLIYTASDGKFVLTGQPKNPPSIFDAEHGSVTGDSLTFFSRDDTVLVGSSDSRTRTQTRVKQ